MEVVFVKIIWNLLSLKMSTTLRFRSVGSAFCVNFREERDAEAEMNLLK